MVADEEDAPPVTSTRRVVVRRRAVPRLDRNRPLEVLAVLLLYVIVVHYSLKFVSFLLPDSLPSREESLSLRGSSSAAAIVGNNGIGVAAWGPSSTTRSSSSSSYCDIWRNHRSNIGILSLSTSSRGDAVDIARGESGLNDVIIVDTVVGNRAIDEDIANAPTKKSKRRGRIPVLSYQDDFVIISKPCGMTMHHNANTHTRWGRSKSPVLQTAIHRQLSRKPYLVHRLDHRTSGACILGFSSDAAAELHGRLRGEGATKLYIALVRGDLRGKFQRAAAGRCVVADKSGEDMNADGDGFIICSRGRVPDLRAGGGGRPPETALRDNDEYCGKITVNLPIKVKVEGTEVEKDASTDFYFLSSMTAENDAGDAIKDEMRSTTTRYVNKSLTLLLCHPRTGRTHQIRRHLRKALMAPIVGDVEHGDSRVNRHWREQIGLDRLGLHCWYLGLPPLTSSSSSSSSSLSSSSSSSSSDDSNDIIECMAPLTLDFAGALRHERLKLLWAEACCVEPRLGMEPYDERGGTFGRNYRQRR
jgi:23S rRNA-/tRNA-specific pseudouridylate synthase